MLVIYLLLHAPPLLEIRPLLVPHPPHPLGVIEPDTQVDDCRVAGLIGEGEAIEQGHEVGVPRVGTSAGKLVTRQTRIAIAQEEGEGQGHQGDRGVTEGFAGDHYTRLQSLLTFILERPNEVWMIPSKNEFLLRDDSERQLLSAAGAEQRRMRVAKPINLRLHGRDHMRMAMAKAGNGGAAGAINHIMPR